MDVGGGPPATLVATRRLEMRNSYSAHSAGNKTGGALIAFAIVWGWVALAVGWIANVVKLASSGIGSLDILTILRVVGILFAPLGAILGYV